MRNNANSKMQTKLLSSGNQNSEIGDSNSKNFELSFTGNWFIDAGILGFVNLMEEVYGWDLKKLKEEIKNNSDVVYYGYFPFAYLFYHSKIRGTYKKIANNNKEIRDKKTKLREEEKKLLKKEDKDNEKRGKIQNKIDEIKDEIGKFDEKNDELRRNLNKEKIELQEKINPNITEILKNANKDFSNSKEKINLLIPDFELNIPASHRNFFLYNPKKEIHISFSYLYWLLKKDYLKLEKIRQETSEKKKQELTYEKFPDSTVNPFLFSYGIENLSYSLPLTLEQRENSMGIKLPIYLIHLSFYNSFEFIDGRNIMFYANNLELCYKINTKIKSKLKLLRKEGSQSIFQITLASIIDTLAEEKSKFSLENMYLIEYENIEHLKLKGVEYIEIPKLQASIILEDIITDNLNKSIAVQKLKENKFIYLWLLEEFIKNKPLYPLISKHIYLGISGNLQKNHFISKTTSLYALAIDANIKQFNKNSNKKVFSDDFFESYEWLVDKIKEDYKCMRKESYNMRDIFKDSDKEKVIYSLFSTVENHNKTEFLDVIIKNLLDKEDSEKTLYINNYLFKYVLNNDICWENYALSLIVNIEDN